MRGSDLQSVVLIVLKFGYSFIKNDIYMYLSFIYKISIILSLLNIVTLHFTMYILTVLTCFLKMYTIYFFLNVTWSKYLLHKKK